MRFSWIRARGVVAVSAAVMALQGVPAFAQFVPYNGNANQGFNQQQAHTAQQAQPQYAQPQNAQPQYTQPQYTQPQYAQPQYTQPQAQYNQPQYVQPQYTAMAYQGSESRGMNTPVESVAPGQVMQPTPAAGCNCQAAPAAGYSQAAPYESYSAGAGTCGAYNTFDGGCGVGAAYRGAGCSAGCGTGGGCLDGCGCGRSCGRGWFGGFYGLYMERVGNPWKALAFSTLDTNPAGYYPADNETVLNLTDIDNDTFAGAEVRFGSTLGGRGGCGCGPRFGWEAAYWGLVEETTTAVVTDTIADGNRLYGMMPHTGAFYNGRPVNDYYEYGPPTANPVGDTIRLRQLTAQNSFSMQNLEVNLLHFPLYGGGYYAAAAGGYGGGRGQGHRGGVGAGGCCDTGCGGNSCCGCAPRCSITGVAGFRFVRMDEDFMYRADYENETASTFGFISHGVDVDSQLFGAQLGCNALYRCGCSGRWALHCNSVVGIFNNHTEVWNRMDAPVAGGDVTLQNGDTFDLRYEDDNVALLGELRAGGSYQYSCHCRFFGGYRLLGISGAALAFDQISNQNISAVQTSYVDSDGSIFIHGLQAGVEYVY